MKCKILLLAAIAFGMIDVCYAQTYTNYSQTSDAEAEAVINLLGVQKREAITKLVPVSGPDSVMFWKIYDEYEKTNKNLAKERLSLYEGTAHAYMQMNPTVADSLAQLYFANRLDQEKLTQSYYKKIKSATNAVIAFEFYQAEVYILTQVRAQIMQQIPTFGALVTAAKKQ